MKKLSLSLVVFAGCTSSSFDASKIKPQELYKNGTESLNNQDFKEAAERFLDIDRFHPTHPLALNGQLMSGYASFMGQKYNDAIDAFLLFIHLNPENAYTPYAQYMVGMCYYAQTQHVERDHSVIEKAGQSFEELIEKFPHSVYAKDAKLKMDFIRTHLAAKEMTIGSYYQKSNNPIAALRRFNEVVTHFPKTPQAAEALYRIIECQISLGLEAKNTMKILELNFKKSPWYSKAKDLLSAQALR